MSGFVPVSFKDMSFESFIPWKWEYDESLTFLNNLDFVNGLTTMNSKGLKLMEQKQPEVLVSEEPIQIFILLNNILFSQ